MVLPRLTANLAAAVAVVAMLVPSAAARAEPVTPGAAIESLAARKHLVAIPDFRLGGRYDAGQPDSFASGGEGGTPLEHLASPPLELGYIALGTPERNSDGDIVNAVVVLSNEWGDATTLYARWVEGLGANGARYPPPIGPGALIDTDRFFVVLLDSVGLWGTAKPSAGLGTGFPSYSVLDSVQAGYRLLRDHLRIAKTDLVTGVSLGGAEAWAWAALHPEFVNAVMPLAGTTQADDEAPVARWTLQLMGAAIEADPAWRRSEGRYYALPKAEHPNRGVMFGFSVFDLFTRGLGARAPAAAILPEVFSWAAVAGEGATLADRAAVYDAVDLIWRIRAATAFNINSLLGRITAPLLAIHVADDPWLVADKAAAAVHRVPGAEMITLAPDATGGRDALPALSGLVRDPAMQTFLERADLGSDPAARTSGVHARMPRVSPVAVPGRNFWEAQVTYPFPITETQVSDGSGRPWDIAYMDVFADAASDEADNAGTADADSAADPLLVLHDRGLTAAAFGDTIAYAARRGIRVIAPDLPPYGMSGPANIARPWTRSLADLRAMLTDLVRRHLGIERAACLGQGMGAQLCLGLALDHPEFIDRVVLVAPDVLAPVPPAIDTPAGSKPLFDPSLAADEARWRDVWGAPALISAEMARGTAAIEAALLPAGPSVSMSLVPTSPKGPAWPPLFTRNSAYARFLVDLRNGVASADRRALEQYATALAFDAYAEGIERLEGDGASLPARAARLTVPVMVALGALAPLPPPLLPELSMPPAADLVGGFSDRLSAAGNPPIVCIYPNAGSVVPVDTPIAFAKDVIDFLKGRPVTEMTPAVISSLLAAAAPTIGSGEPQSVEGLR